MIDAVKWGPTRYARNGEVEIAWDQLVGSQGDPLLLIMGLGTSRFWWPAALCRSFADEGFQVVRYDQRDAGQSTRMPDVSDANPFSALFRKRAGAYTSEDMTDDAVAVIDDLGWSGAHLFGHSLGGVVAQRLALRHPDRVLSVVSSAALPSDTSGVKVARYLRFGLLARLARTKFPEGREGDIAASLAVARGVASPAYPFDEDVAREWIERGVDSGPRDKKAQSRQIGAQWHGRRLLELDKPTLVMHGDADPILRLSAGRTTAARIAGARMITWPGVGHDLPEPLSRDVARVVRDLADSA
ncbi:alpha/beta hydrolase [Aeromicrobium sp. Marseille-Q0843]|uniref:Alpha/beta hydrolase n=1 Tax=Aeromicrobium phoceense TaxID=2754045 RepID=A0A838XCJ1_9ACTN|nr:alpha/beta hydrolase [Aeromicrobium phoceense]MBA4608255.1 alpha/beta hydrolase [Aeromicrobium phoceense]